VPSGWPVLREPVGAWRRSRRRSQAIRNQIADARTATTPNATRNTKAPSTAATTRAIAETMLAARRANGLRAEAEGSCLRCCMEDPVRRAGGGMSRSGHLPSFRAGNDERQPPDQPGVSVDVLSTIWTAVPVAFQLPLAL